VTFGLDGLGALPNMRVQRTRSSPSAPHSPLTRYPLGSAWRQAAIVAGIHLAVVAAACASSAGARKAEACRGSLQEFGKIRDSSLGFRVVGSNGRGVSGLSWRYRKRFIFPGRWSDWEQGEKGQCEEFDSCGYLGVSDQEEGVWEVEVCAPGYRPLHGYIELRYSWKGPPVIVTAPSAE